MQLTNTGLVCSPSDLNHFVECEHLTALDLLAVEGHGVPKEKDPQAEILRAKGFEHEQAWLQHLREAGREIVEIAVNGNADWHRDAERTAAAMRNGAKVIYQAVFVDNDWRGVADFLIRVDRASHLGPWSYEACDAKLARHPKPYFVLQLAWYTEQLARIQGLMPEHMQVVLGTRETMAFRPNDFLAYYRAVRGRFMRAVSARAATYPLPVPHCRLCGYTSHCGAQREADDHLSLVAWMRRDQVERFETAGIDTVAALAQFDPGVSTGITPQTQARLVRQAQLQVEARTVGHHYELLPPEAKRGFGLLPAPSDGDIFFDIEGYPFFESSRGLEYLWGVEYRNPHWHFRAFECLDRVGEKRAFEQFIDFLYERLAIYPDLHVYHYATYETSAIKRLMGEHATREAEVDELLQRGVFVDLYQVVRQSMQISYDSYSLKKIREFFMEGAGAGAITEGGESILEFQKFLDTGDEAILQAIRNYNAEDCVSTRLLRDWLVKCKAEAESQFGTVIPWYVKAEGAERAPEDRDVNRDIRQQLTTVAERVSDPARSAAARLLSYLVDYHRREAKPGWWAFFERLKKSLDELRLDTEAIAYLSPVGGVEPHAVGNNLVHMLEFPDQEFKVRPGKVVDTVEGKEAGTIVDIFPNGQLALRRGHAFVDAAIPNAVMSDGPVRTDAQRASLVRIGDAFVDGGQRHRVGRDLLMRAVPRIRGLNPGSILQTMNLDEQKALVGALDESHLFIQGPPGSGKTYLGARLIVSLLEAGKRVAVTATSHKTIHNLLDNVIVAAQEARVEVRGLKKTGSGDDSVYEREGFENTGDNRECAGSDANLVAGTSWLFARGEMESQFDTLFIDEAGQVALADAVAMSPCAHNVVLLGDPQQLPHVTQGIHPGGAGVSVLEHLLGNAATVAPYRGLFLDRTWRMHPDVCGFISDLSYDGRLQSVDRCAVQAIDSAGLTGTGLRYVPVEHTGNSQQSNEEAEAISAEARRLLDAGTFTDCFGERRTLTPADILVVAPYNMQVRTLLQAVPAGVEVGTVDKFQGREAPIVFFSMASSSGEDIPRGVEFLFSRNRLNVAVSRAKAMAVLVCSPRLLETRCRTVDQMRLVNGLCKFVEHSASAAAHL